MLLTLPNIVSMTTAERNNKGRRVLIGQKKMYKYPTSLLFCLFPESRLLQVLATKQQ